MKPRTRPEGPVPRPDASGRPPRSSRHPTPPPPRGIPLSLILGPLLAIVVGVVLAGLTVVEQRREISRERQARVELLEQGLAPVADAIERAGSLADIRELVLEARTAYAERGHPVHDLRLEDATGQPVVEFGDLERATPGADAITARTVVHSNLIPGGDGTLVAWKDGGNLARDVHDRWRAWWLDLLWTSLALIIAVEIAVHLLIGRPLSKLVRNLQRLEQGHPADWNTGPGAWEIRWLAWRINMLGSELADSVRRLVAADRRALSAARHRGRPGVRRLTAPRPVHLVRPPVADESLLVRRYLEDTCRLLEAMQPSDPASTFEAEDAWRRAAVEAERVGDMALKARIENAALRLLEPESFDSIQRRLGELRRSRAGWIHDVGTRLEAAVTGADVAVELVQFRIKHVAGAWRKMRDRQLDLEEVHDLFAYRIVVPDESACYLALASIHEIFDPEPFRFKDYVAEPKANGYRSLHTSVRDEAGRVFEVQIRSVGMHDEAEDGHAAHWRYRADRWNGLDDLSPRRPMGWLRRLSPG
jgi:hypothetical protein